MQESFFNKLARKCEVVIGRLESLGDYQIKRQLRKLNGVFEFDIAFDVGGNLGQFGQLLRASGYRNDIVSFEPIPDLAQSIRQIADTRWTVMEMGLGSSVETKSFNIMKSSPLSSFMNPKRSEYDNLTRMNEVENVIEVFVTTLDEFIRRPGIKNFKNGILKLDVQGYEKECLLGAGENLDRFSTIIIEMSASPIYEGADKYYDMMKFIEDRGYSLSLIASSPSYQFPKIVDFDCIYVKEKFN